MNKLGQSYKKKFRQSFWTNFLQTKKFITDLIELIGSARPKLDV